MWLLIKSRYQREDESGSLKTINEQHLFDATSWTEGESRFYGLFQSAANSPERTILGITPLRLSDMIGDGEFEIWYKVKYSYISTSDSGKDKKVTYTMLVNADHLEHARGISAREFDKWLITCNIDSIIETPILEVFPYTSEEELEIPGNLRPLAEVLSERENAPFEVTEK